MKITQEVRDFAAKQNQAPDTFIAAEEAEAGMAAMSEKYPRDWLGALCRVRWAGARLNRKFDDLEKIGVVSQGKGGFRW